MRDRCFFADVAAYRGPYGGRVPNTNGVAVVRNRPGQTGFVVRLRDVSVQNGEPLVSKSRMGVFDRGENLQIGVNSPLEFFGKFSRIRTHRHRPPAHVRLIRLIEPSAGDNDQATPGDPDGFVAPRVLISYSHDSPQHATRILAISNQLRNDGIDCWIDQYDPHPAEGWPLWMERQVERADFVLIVCTERYYRRARGEEAPGVGRGVAWESVLIRNELYDVPHANTKFIPILLQSEDERWILPRLHGYTHYTLDRMQLERDADYARLYRTITNQPAVEVPEVGKLRKMPPVIVHSASGD